MSKSLRIALWCMATAGLLLLAALFAIQHFYADDIKAGIIAYLNGQLEAEVSVSGQIELDVWSQFPDVAVRFESVEIDGSTGGGGSEPLLKLESVSAGFSLRKLMQADYTIDRLVLVGGELFIHQDADGLMNTRVFGTGSQGGGKDFLLTLSEARLRDVKTRILLEKSDFDLSFLADELRLSGQFLKGGLDLSCAGFLLVDSLAMPEYRTGRHRLDLDGRIAYLADSTLFKFALDRFRLDGNELDIEGRYHDGHKMLELHGSAGNVALENLPDVLPESVSKAFDRFDIHGVYELTASLRLPMERASEMSMEMGIDIGGGSFRLPGEKAGFSEVDCRLDYHRHRNNDRIQLSGFKALMNGHPVQLELLLSNLDQPEIELESSGPLDLALIRPFLPEGKLSKLEGALDIQRFRYAGKILSTDPLRIRHDQIDGAVDIAEFGLHMPGFRIDSLAGLLSWNKKIIQTDALAFRLNDSDFEFSGSLQQLFPYLFDLMESGSSKEAIVANGQLYSPKIDFSNKAAAPSGGSVELHRLFRLKGAVELKIDQAQLPGLAVQQIAGRVQLKPGQLRLEEFAFNSCGGAARADGMVLINTDNSIDVHINPEVSDLDISDLFRQMNNFGQQELTDRHLSGRMDAEGEISLHFNPQLKFVSERMLAEIDLRLREGVLRDYAPMRKLSKVIRMEYLEEIAFEELENQIRIRDRQIEIPLMTIENSALDIELKGTHGFNQEIDYTAVVSLREVLGRKFRKRVRQDLYFESPDTETVRMYVRIYGPLDQLKVDINDKGARQEVIAEKENKDPEGIAARKEKVSERKYFQDDEKEADEYINWD